MIALDVVDQNYMDRISGETGIVIDSVPKKQKFVDLVRYENSGVAGYFTDQKPFYKKSVLKNLWSKIRG